MDVDSAISDAQYGIDKLKANAEPFDFYLKGTLACLKGILDYLLEEYNSKYSVGIGEDEDLNVRSFKDKVKDGKNPKADQFIDFYITEKKNLMTDQMRKAARTPSFKGHCVTSQSVAQGFGC